MYLSRVRVMNPAPSSAHRLDTGLSMTATPSSTTAYSPSGIVGIGSGTCGRFAACTTCSGTIATALSSPSGACEWCTASGDHASAPRSGDHASTPRSGDHASALRSGRQMRSIFPASAHNLAPGRPFHLAGARSDWSRDVAVWVRDMISCYFNRGNQNPIATASHTRTTGKRDPATRTALLNICFLFRRARYTRRTMPKTHA